MEPPYLDPIRQSYDAVAADYARTVKDPSELDPLSRAVLGAFAELVTSADLGPTADVGCGPGKVTAYMTGLGVSAFGVDLSPRMVGLGRAAHPELRFDVGSMTALETGDGELGGILAFYSTHHLPAESLPGVFADFHPASVPCAAPQGAISPSSPTPPRARPPAACAGRRRSVRAGSTRRPGDRRRSRARRSRRCGRASRRPA